MSPSTINTRLKTLRNIFNCLLAEEVTNSNPIEGVSHAPNPLENINVLTLDEMRKLLNAVTKKTYAGLRDYVLIGLLIDSMVRIGETLSLKESDFNLSESTVTIRASIAKSRKSRTLSLRPLTIRSIKRLIEVNKEFNNEYVFLTNYGEQFKRDHFRIRLKLHSKKADIKKNVYPH